MLQMKYPKRIYYTEADKALMCTAFDSATFWSQSLIDSGDSVADWRYSSAGSAPFGQVAVVG
jgi:hypothetical protein